MQSQETSDGFMTSHIFEKGFIVPNGLDVPPPAQLDAPYHLWDDALRAASGIRLRVEDASPAAEEWRQCLEKMPVLPLSPLLESVSTLLCARRILAFLTQLYVHSIPDATTRIIPPSIAIPFLVVSHALDLPPVVTFADTEFYNFAVPPTQSLAPDTDTEFRILSNFSGTPDEAHFYVTGLIVELEGVSALRLMRRAIEAVHECDGSSARDAVIAPLLLKLAGQIRRMATALDAVRVGCDPSVYYDDVRLWFNGPGKHQWRFAVTGVEGTEDGEALRAALQGRWIRNVQDGYVEPADMAGASAAQSSTIQALDAFLGIAEETHETKHGRGNFLEAMRAYMPRDHREFIACLAREGAVLRDSIAADADEGTRKAYNVAVDALRHLRTVHIKIATLYIVNPRRRAALSTGKSIASPSLGTGGTAAIPFLKHIRNWTAAATL